MMRLSLPESGYRGSRLSVNRWLEYAAEQPHASAGISTRLLRRFVEGVYATVVFIGVVLWTPQPARTTAATVADVTRSRLRFIGVYW